MGVVSNDWFDRVLLFSSLHDQSLVLTDVQTLFLGTPLVPDGKPCQAVEEEGSSRFAHTKALSAVRWLPSFAVFGSAACHRVQGACPHPFLCRENAQTQVLFV